MHYPEMAKLVQIDTSKLLELEKAAANDETWKELENNPEWKDKVDDILKKALRSGVTLYDGNIDFTLS